MHDFMELKGKRLNCAPRVHLDAEKWRIVLLVHLMPLKSNWKHSFSVADLFKAAEERICGRYAEGLSVYCRAEVQLMHKQGWDFWTYLWNAGRKRDQKAKV